MNPVQIRATVDLYPSTRSALAGHMHHPEAPAGWLTRYPNILTEESADWLIFLKSSTWIVSSLPKQAYAVNKRDQVEFNPCANQSGRGMLGIDCSHSQILHY